MICYSTPISLAHPTLDAFFWTDQIFIICATLFTFSSCLKTLINWSQCVAMQFRVLLLRFLIFFLQPTMPTFQYYGHLILHMFIARWKIYIFKTHIQNFFYDIQLFSRLLLNVINGGIELQGMPLKWNQPSAPTTTNGSSW